MNKPDTEGSHDDLEEVKPLDRSELEALQSLLGTLHDVTIQVAHALEDTGLDTEDEQEQYATAIQVHAHTHYFLDTRLPELLGPKTIDDLLADIFPEG